MSVIATKRAALSVVDTERSDHSAVRLRRLLRPTTLDLSIAPFMMRLRYHPIAVLSPHFDDACFSLGGLLKTIGHGTLINVFTQGRYLANTKLEPLPQTDVFALRDAEDEKFARACGLNRINLEGKEPMLQDRRISDLSGVPDDLEQMEGPVLSTLAHVASDFHPRERGTLFAPLGVGSHCNHRALNELIINNIAVISEKFEIMLYEDQPYSSSVFSRIAALRRMGRCCDLSSGVRYVFPNDWTQKRALIELYSTQLRSTPRRHRFRPAALSPLAPHEAFWEISAKRCAYAAE